jgi:hypothetical protein
MSNKYNNNYDDDDDYEIEENDDDLQAVICPVCCVKFGITIAMYDMRAEDQKTVYCPNGHNLVIEFNYYREYNEKVTSENEELKDKNLLLSHRLEQMEALIETQKEKK